jgi:hydroxyacylglutathione hydrolase
MKKNVKRILWSAGLVLILLIGLLGVRIYRMTSDMKKMKPVDTGEVVPGVFAVKDVYVNLYLVKGAAGYVAFDSGNGPESVRSGLSKLNIDPAGVVAVFLTHADADHAGGLPVFPNARVFLANEEEQMIDGRTARFAVFKNKPIREHTPLNDNQTVEIGGVKVTAVLTPGHTPGSMCYLVDGQNLFTGDTMRLTSGAAGIFSKTINMDSDAQLRSLKKLAGLSGVKYVFTAHFGYTDDFGKAFEAFRK